MNWSRLEKVLLVPAVLMLFGIVILTLVQVFFRYVLNDALTWSAELTKLVFVWLTFLGSCVAINRKRHLRIDTIINMFPDRLRPKIEIVSYIIIIIFLFVLLIKGTGVAIDSWALKSPAMRYPMTLLILPIPLASVFMILFSFRRISIELQEMKEIAKAGGGKDVN